MLLKPTIIGSDLPFLSLILLCSLLFLAFLMPPTCTCKIAITIDSSIANYSQLHLIRQLCEHLRTKGHYMLSGFSHPALSMQRAGCEKPDYMQCHILTVGLRGVGLSEVDCTIIQTYAWLCCFLLIKCLNDLSRSHDFATALDSFN